MGNLDWELPPDWPPDIDARWRSDVLRDAATYIVSSDTTCSLEYDGPPRVWMSVHRDTHEIARVLANRSPEDKAKCMFTLIAGPEASAVDCSSISKLVFLVKQTRGTLPTEGGALLPPALRYLQPAAERGDRVGSQVDVEATIARLTPGERADLIGVYRAIAARDDSPAIDRWIEAHTTDVVSGKVVNLLFLLDGLARAGSVPEDLARYRLVQWDHRTHDGRGNEW